MKKMKIALAVILGALTVFALCSCGNKKEYRFTVTKDEEFGGIDLEAAVDEFNALGFEYGDSVNVKFDSGFELRDIPYLNGYYIKTGEPLLIAYPGTNLSVKYCNESTAWDQAGCSEGDTVMISPAKKGKYKDVQDAFDMVYFNEREKYGSDEMFANFRALTGGRIRENTFFRGASPVDNKFNRADYADKLIEKNGIAFILDLSDNEAKLEEYYQKIGFNSPYAYGLYRNGKMALLGLTAAYRGDEYMQSLAAGIRLMLENEGPYYVHCTEGKDRTGFVCMLFESLAGASYKEMEADYMVTYYCYYGIDKDKDADKYRIVANVKFDDMYSWMTGGGSIDPQVGAEMYLEKAGMTRDEIHAFEILLTGEE